MVVKTTFYSVAFSLLLVSSISPERACAAKDQVSPLQAKVNEQIPDKTTAALQELRDFSIEWKPPHFHSFGTHGMACPVQLPMKKAYVVTRPGANNWVAIIQVKNDTQATSAEEFELNPDRGYAYGPIPSLEQMTHSAADALWGSKPITADSPPAQDGNVTYTLVSINKASMGKEFYFHCSFNNGRLVHFEIEAQK